MVHSSTLPRPLTQLNRVLRGCIQSDQSFNPRFCYFSASLISVFDRSFSLISLISSLVLSNLAFAWLKGFSGLFSNSFLMASIFCCLLRPFCSSSISGNRLASYAAYAALNLRSGCRSIFSEGLAEVSDKASSALSMPVAFRAGLAVSEVEGASSWERSRPRVFLTAVFAPAPFGVARASFSSSARRASFSAFLRAASCFFCSASSL